MAELDGDYFDSWYAAMSVSTRQERIQQSALGLPAELQSSSLLTWDGIADVVAELRLKRDEVLVDLACGRGGYGMEIAQRTEARLIGVDFSAVAIEQAQRRATELGRSERTEFRVGELTAAGLPASSANAIVCVDAIQFARPTDVALAECRRVLVPGGRLVLTCWETLDRSAPPSPSRLDLDLERSLVDGGFAEVVVRSMPQWRDAERAMWEAAIAEDPGDDPAMESMRAEGTRALASFDNVRRVLASATAPQAAV